DQDRLAASFLALSGLAAFLSNSVSARAIMLRWRWGLGAGQPCHIKGRTTLTEILEIGQKIVAVHLHGLREMNQSTTCSGKRSASPVERWKIRTARRAASASLTLSTHVAACARPRVAIREQHQTPNSLR